MNERMNKQIHIRVKLRPHPPVTDVEQEPESPLSSQLFSPFIQFKLTPEHGAGENCTHTSPLDSSCVPSSLFF